MSDYPLSSVKALKIDLPPLMPLVKEAATQQDVDSFFLEMGQKSVCNGMLSSLPASSWLPRKDLETLFPGVLFYGDSIFVEPDVLIAPGTMIDASLPNTAIELRGTTVIGRGSLLVGNILIEDSSLRAGVKMSGSLRVERTQIASGISLVGEDIYICESFVAGPLSGKYLFVNQSTIEETGGIVGSLLMVSSFQVLQKMLLGRNRR